MYICLKINIYVFVLISYTQFSIIKIMCSCKKRAKVNEGNTYDMLLLWKIYIYIIKVKKYKEGNNEIKIKTGTTVLANG